MLSSILTMLEKIYPCKLATWLTVIILCTFVTIPLELSAQKQIPFELPPKSELAKLKSAIIYTSYGEIYLELYPKDAPWHVANFKYLADKGFYRGSRFHIYYTNYIIQGGGSTSNPSSGPGYSLPAEFNQHSHVPGTLGMARKPDEINPNRNSHGSQFHLLLSDARHMDGRYTVFGKITKGINVMYQLGKGDQIKDIKVFVRRDD